jgi:RNA polymerase sigma-54 factor
MVNSFLAYTNQELDAFMQTEYLENPLLETSMERQEETIQSLEKFYENGIAEDGIEDREEDEEDRRGDVRAKEQGTIENMVLEQLPHGAYSKEEWNIFRYLSKCLDDHGFFPFETADIAKVSGYSEEKIELCLEELKKLEPAGIFAKDLSECLMLQLQRMGEEDEKLYQIAEKYLEEIFQGHISSVTRILHISTAKAKEYMHLLSTLNPRPLMSGNKETQYLLPDILVIREGNHWKAELNDKWMGEYYLNEDYLRMMEDVKDEELKTYFTEKLRRAEDMLDGVKRRRETILKVVYAVLEHQKEHFLHKKPLVPMTQDEIAAKTKLSLEVVACVVKGKYLQYHSTILLKDLFSD